MWQAFDLSDALSGLVQTAFYFGYLFGGLPAACVARRFGYKVCVCTGLGLVCAGATLFWPCSSGDDPQYAALLLCLYLLAFGLAFLECSANPWIIILAERRHAGAGTRALNLAQAVNPLGSLGGVLLGRELVLGAPVPERIAAVGRVYLSLAATFACVALAFLVVRFPAGDGRVTSQRATLGCAHMRGALRRRGFVAGVAAQFLNIGAQTCCWSYTIRYVRDALPGVSDQSAADVLLLSLGGFFLGRIASTGLLRCVAADVLLFAQCVLAALGCVVAIAAGGALGVTALVVVSAAFGMAFPTIFALSLAQLDAEHSEVGASLLVMAIIGGALVTPLMGLVSDARGVRAAYGVPALCYVGMAIYAGAHACGCFARSEGLLAGARAASVEVVAGPSDDRPPMRPPTARPHELQQTGAV